MRNSQKYFLTVLFFLVLINGFSSSLIEELCQYLKVLSCECIQLAWIFDNPQAQHFYLKNGFKPIEKKVSNSNDIVMLAVREL